MKAGTAIVAKALRAWLVARLWPGIVPGRHMLCSWSARTKGQKHLGRQQIALHTNSVRPTVSTSPGPVRANRGLPAGLPK